MSDKTGDSGDGSYIASIRDDHGLFVEAGSIIFQVGFYLTGWGILHIFMFRLSGLKRRFYSPERRKWKPAFQDILVLMGVSVTIIIVLTFNSSNAATLREVLIFIGGWHIFGMIVYHTNALLFDQLGRNYDPRVWSFNRVFIQAIINIAELTVIFAIFYSNASGLSFGEAIFVSVQVLTLNIPIEFQQGQLTRILKYLWTIHVILNIFLIVVVLAQLGSAMFKREELARNPSRDARQNEVSSD